MEEQPRADGGDEPASDGARGSRTMRWKSSPLSVFQSGETFHSTSPATAHGPTWTKFKITKPHEAAHTFLRSPYRTFVPRACRRTARRFRLEPNHKSRHQRPATSRASVRPTVRSQPGQLAQEPPHTYGYYQPFLCFNHFWGHTCIVSCNASDPHVSDPKPQAFSR